MSARALVLGAAGFLGSHLCRRLVTDGWHVTGLVRDKHAPQVLRRLGPWLGAIDLVSGDARDPFLLRSLVEGVDAVFPFAGESGAPRSVSNPLADARGNVLPHLELLEALRARNPAAISVFPGSRLQYGRVDHIPVDESTAQHPASIYGLHKQVAEGYYRLYHELHGLPTVRLRISNPYGPHQERADCAFGVVGTFLAAAANDETIRLYGGGTQLRDFVYVDDVLDLVVRCLQSSAAIGRVFNVGGPAASSLREMADFVVDVVGRGRIVEVPWPELDLLVETGDYVTDSSLATELLGWRPETGLREGIARCWASIEKEERSVTGAQRW